MLIKSASEKIILPGLNNFGNFILQNRARVSNKIFADEFCKLEQHYVREHQENVFCKEANSLIDRLIEENEPDLAGIAASILCKLNEQNPKYLEIFAKKGYDISQMNGDYVHMMARLNDLRKLYTGCKERLFDYIQVLYRQEKCLKKLTRDYPETSLSFRTVSRTIAPRETYERMLGYVQIEIGKLTRKKHPHDALYKLTSARTIFQKNQNFQSIEYINGLIREIEAGMVAAE